MLPSVKCRDYCMKDARHFIDQDLQIRYFAFEQVTNTLRKQQLRFELRY